MTGPDTHVRLALPRDVAAVAAIQARVWRQTYRELFPEQVLAELESAATVQWTQAVMAPPTDAHHLLVALDGVRVVGFAAVAPSEDADAEPTQVGELAILTVDPSSRGAGHGSRLLSAAAETMATNGLRTATSWVPEADTALRHFLESAGWAADGARRSLDTGGAPLVELRLHTALA
ncbi:MAG TPA: GNAT family N-acetyltransferase [Mycobacteriales bacterium]|jgi:GNAT superfamily N-acetyltransferase|nr:GNAT family N-acetyltransferase [Mycobacteriales bacterium]